MRFPGFSPKAISFLRNLKRNNRREWFQPRKEQYETLIKQPMLELAGCINEGLERFAPQYVTPPQKAVYRIYRDTRFSANKAPYKTHVAAMFNRNTAIKREGAVFYFHFTESELLVFGGVYTPEPEELRAYRALLEQRHEEFEAILADKRLRRVTGGLQGEQLSRPPKGFAAGHPAEALLRHKQWYLEVVLDVKVLATPRVVQEIAKGFAVMAPFVEFLNQAIVQKPKLKKMPFMAF